MQKIAITGATGFIGSCLVRHLAAQNRHDIHALRHESKPASLTDPPLTWHSGDITKPETLASWVAGADYVIHAAGLLGRAGVPESRYTAINAEGTRHVLQAIAQHAPHAKAMVLSSAGVLGPIPAPPKGQQPTIWPDETAPLAPSNAYERSKAAGEKITAELAQKHRLHVVIARPEFVYGPGDTHVLGLFQMIQRGLFFYIGDGQNTCHPTFIDDAVDGLLRALWHGRAGQILHITGPRPLTFRELANTIADQVGGKRPWLALPTPLVQAGAIAGETLGRLTGLTPPLSRTGVAFFSEYRGSTSAKAATQINYIPQIDLTEGIQRTVAWYRQKGHLPE